MFFIMVNSISCINISIINDGLCQLWMWSISFLVWNYFDFVLILLVFNYIENTGSYKNNNNKDNNYNNFISFFFWWNYTNRVLKFKFSIIYIFIWICNNKYSLIDWNTIIHSSLWHLIVFNPHNWEFSFISIFSAVNINIHVLHFWKVYC